MLGNLLIKILRILFDYSAGIIGPKFINNLKVTNIDYKTIKLRIYEPLNLTDRITPVIIYYHGGGWIVGSIEAYDRILRYISFNSKSILVGIEYRKAPEYKFPTAANDALLAYEWVIDNLPLAKNNLIIAGDSAGGNLALTVINHIVKNKKAMPKGQILIYPVINFKKGRLLKLCNSFIKKVTYYIFLFCLKHYLTDFKHLKSNPLFPAIDFYSIRSIQTLLITSEFDLLNEQIIEFEANLNKFKNKIIRKHFLNCTHGFLQFAGLNNNAKKALDDIVTFINSVKESNNI